MSRASTKYSQKVWSRQAGRNNTLKGEGKQLVPFPLAAVMFVPVHRKKMNIFVPLNAVYTNYIPFFCLICNQLFYCRICVFACIRCQNVIFLGEEHGHAAIFYQRDKAHTIYCEIFPNDGAAYIRACKTAGGQLVRGKKKAGLDTKGIKLCSGDFIEMKCGTFLVEFI